MKPVRAALLLAGVLALAGCGREARPMPEASEAASASASSAVQPTSTVPVSTVTIVELQSAEDAVDHVAISPDGQLLATSNPGGGVMLRNTRNESIAHIEAGANDVAFSPDGRSLAIAVDKTVQIWDVAARRLSESLPSQHTDIVTHVAFTPDGRYVASGGADATVGLWDIGSRRWAGLLRADASNPLEQMTVSPDSRYLAIGQQYSSAVTVWDLATQERVGQPIPGSGGVAFSPDGRLLAAGDTDGSVRLFNVATGQQMGAPFTGVTAEIRALAFSPDGRLLAAGSGGPGAMARDGQTVLWSVAGRQQVAVLGNGETGATVKGLAFSPDGQLLAAASTFDGTRLWSVEVQNG